MRWLMRYSMRSDILLEKGQRICRMSVTCLISRKCFRCRLERCFTMGMRKDFILNQEEIQRRKDSGRN